MIVETFPAGTAVKIIHGSLRDRIGLVLSSQEIFVADAGHTYNEITYKILVGEKTIRFVSNFDVKRL